MKRRSPRKFLSVLSVLPALPVLLVCIPAALRAQAPVPIEREPHHRPVLEVGPVRILDVRIAPGDTTLYHIHDRAILYTAIATVPTDAQPLGGAWGGATATSDPGWRPGDTRSDTLYATRSLTHRVTNVGTGQFRLIAVLNAHKGGPPAAGEGAESPGTPELQSSWFRQTRLTLAPGRSSDWYTSSAPIVIVQPGTGPAVVDQESTKKEDPLKGPGDWTYVPPGARYRVTNPGTAPTVVVIVRAR